VPSSAVADGDETGAGLSVSTVTSSERATTVPSTTRNTRRVSSMVGHWALTASTRRAAGTDTVYCEAPASSGSAQWSRRSGPQS
jgi:hypothetical protein